MGDIVAVARALLDCMARRHPIAVAIKQHASEEARLASFSIIVALGRVAGKLGLDRLSGRSVPLASGTRINFRSVEGVIEY